MSTKYKLTINNDDTFQVDNAYLPEGQWRNFSGGPTRFDPNNKDKHFDIFLNDDDADRLADLGYNVKWLEPKNPSEPRQAHLKVFIKYDTYPKYRPRIWQVRPGKRPLLLSEDLVAQLDADDNIANVDLLVRPYDWEYAGGRTGRKAMVKQMYVTIEQSTFGRQYWPDDDDDDEEMPFK